MNNIKLRKILPIGLLLFTIVACNRDKPGKDIIPPEIMVPVLFDMHMNYAVQSEPAFRELISNVDSVDALSYIFDKHNVTSAEFDSSVAWYSRHPDLFTGIYDEVVMKLTRLADSLDPDRER